MPVKTKRMAQASRADEETNKRQQLNDGRLFGNPIKAFKDKNSTAIEDESDEEIRSSSVLSQSITHTNDGRLRIQLQATNKSNPRESTTEDERSSDSDHKLHSTKRRMTQRNTCRSMSLLQNSLVDMSEVEEQADAEEFSENEYKPGNSVR